MTAESEIKTQGKRRLIFGVDSAPVPPTPANIADYHRKLAAHSHWWAGLWGWITFWVFLIAMVLYHITDIDATLRVGKTVLPAGPSFGLETFLTYLAWIFTIISFFVWLGYHDSALLEGERAAVASRRTDPTGDTDPKR